MNLSWNCILGSLEARPRVGSRPELGSKIPHFTSVTGSRLRFFGITMAPAVPAPSPRAQRHLQTDLRSVFFSRSRSIFIHFRILEFSQFSSLWKWRFPKSWRYPQSSSILDWDFPWNKPSSVLGGTPIFWAGKPHNMMNHGISHHQSSLNLYRFPPFS